VLTEVDLGEEAIAFLRSRLLQGNTLSASLLQMPLESGRIVALLPANTDPGAARRFDVGGVTRRIEAVQHLAGLVSDYLGREGFRITVLEDALARPSDPFLTSTGAPFFVYREEVYYWFDNKSPCDEVRIVDYLKRWSARANAGIVARLRCDVDIKTGHSVTHEVLESFARHCDMLLVNAYDGESSLVWRRVQPCEVPL